MINEFDKELRHCIQHSFYVEGYTYMINYEDNNYIMRTHLGHHIDNHHTIEQTIIGTKQILEYLVLRCIPLPLYVEVEKLFIDETF